jgi:hypothetical protein
VVIASGSQAALVPNASNTAAGANVQQSVISGSLPLQVVGASPASLSASAVMMAQSFGTVEIALQNSTGTVLPGVANNRNVGVAPNVQPQTFSVADANGQAVDFSVGVVGGQLVLAAPSAEGKALLASHLTVVLGAAVQALLWPSVR